VSGVIVISMNMPKPGTLWSPRIASYISPARATRCV